jgi:hypothetical protein
MVALAASKSPNSEKESIVVIELDVFNWLLLAHNPMQACNKAQKLKGTCTGSIAQRTREGRATRTPDGILRSGRKRAQGIEIHKLKEQAALTVVRHH